MTPETAAAAGQLLQDIMALRNKIDALDAAIENGHFIAGGPLPTDSPETPIDLPQMTAAESKGIFDAATKVLSARLKAMTGQLAKL